MHSFRDPRRSGPRDAIGRDELRLVAALVHTVPGAEAALATASGDVITVARWRPDALLTPCELRALVAERDDDVLGPFGRIARLDVSGTLLHRGGGLFASTDRADRWLATLLPHESVRDLLHACPADLPDDALRARLVIDVDLATTVIRLSVAHDAWTWRLDELGARARDALLVAELEADLRVARERRAARPDEDGATTRPGEASA